MKLVGAYYKELISFRTFEFLYKYYLRNNSEAQVKALAKRALESDVTIMCVEENPNECPRLILANECQKYEQDLIVEHR